jgi:hypothetical protein
MRAKKAGVGLLVIVAVLLLTVLPGFSQSAATMIQPDALDEDYSIGLERFVVTGSDDAGPEYSACDFATDRNEVYFGQCDDGSDITSGFVFRDIPILKGATVTSAFVEFSVDGPYDNDLELAIHGEASGDAQTFSLASQPIDRPLTDALAEWSIPAADFWQWREKRQTPDLADIVTEIVRRSDWEPGNALAIIVRNAGPAIPNPEDPLNRLHRRVYAYERAMIDPEAEPARLVLTYLDVVDVMLDIKPDGEPNSINCSNARGLIPVAVLTTDSFDATTVDHSTVTFEGASETHVSRLTGEPQRHEEDVDYDGDIDLVFHFRFGDTSLTCDSTDAALLGMTFDGQAIAGTDEVRMVPEGQ